MNLFYSHLSDGENVPLGHGVGADEVEGFAAKLNPEAQIRQKIENSI